MQEISAWLLGTKDYKQGVALYQEYGSSSFLKELFAKGLTPYNKTKLEAELKSLAPKPAPIPEVIDHPKQEELVPVKLDETPPLKREGYIPNDQYRYHGIKDNIKKLYKQLERNMFVLSVEKKESVLHLTAKQILKLWDQVQDCFRLVDYFDEHGVFPDEVEYIPTTDLVQRLMVRISRAKKRLKAPNCRNPKATEDLIKQYEAELVKLRGGKVEA